MGPAPSRPSQPPPEPQPPPPPPNNALSKNCKWNPATAAFVCDAAYNPQQPANVERSPIGPNDPLNVWTDELGRPAWPDAETVNRLLIDPAAGITGEQTYQARSIPYDANAARLAGIMSRDEAQYAAKEGVFGPMRTTLSDQRQRELDVMASTLGTANSTHDSMLSRYQVYRSDYASVAKQDDAVRASADNVTDNLHAVVDDEDGDVGNVCRRVLEIRDSVTGSNDVVRSRVGAAFLTNRGIGLPAITSPTRCGL